MKKPNFFIPGAQKAATTTLHLLLKQHPEIYLPQDKEAWFFHRDHKFALGLEWYVKTYFRGANNEKAVGEVTPEYLYFANVPGRIAKTLGTDIKFIILVRDPIERALSHYQMSWLRGIETRPFWQAMEMEKERIRRGFWEQVHFSYITRGLYARQIQRYLSLFPEKNFLYLVFEQDILEHLKETSKTIQRFLGINYHNLDCQLKANQAGLPRSQLLGQILKSDNLFKDIARALVPSPVLRNRIRKALQKANRKKGRLENFLTIEQRTMLWHKYFKNDVRILEEIIDRDLSVWNPEYYCAG